MEPLWSSLAFYAWVFGVCEVGRRVGDSLLGPGLLKQCLFEFLGTLQICACIFEGSIVGQYYGQAAVSDGIPLAFIGESSWWRLERGPYDCQMW